MQSKGEIKLFKKSAGSPKPNFDAVQTDLAQYRDDRDMLGFPWWEQRAKQ